MDVDERSDLQTGYVNSDKRGHFSCCSECIAAAGIHTAAADAVAAGYIGCERGEIAAAVGEVDALVMLLEMMRLCCCWLV